MEFHYKNPNGAEPQPNLLNLSSAAKEALIKSALGSGDVGRLLENSESPEIESLKDNIESQIPTSLAAANKIIDQLNIFRAPTILNHLQQPTREELISALDIKMEEWEQNGSLAWCNKYIEKNGGSFSLVATPNTLSTLKEIMILAKNFGSTQQPAKEAYIYEEVYKQYSAKELSGHKQISNPVYAGASSIRLSLVPSSIDLSLRGTVVQQRATLQNLQATNPNIQVPSVLDAITYWQTLQSGGDNFVDSTTYETTLMRHFDLGGKELGGYSSVPYSYLAQGGEPRLDGLRVDAHGVARLAVG